jgi:hypothetical protein
VDAGELLVSKFTWQVTVLLSAIILAAGGIGAALVLRPAGVSHPPRPVAAVKRPATPKPSPSVAASPRIRHHPKPEPSAAVAPAPTGPAEPVLLIECNGNGVTEPPSYVLACGDGNGGLSGMTWSSWTSSGATGTGEYYENTCDPDCASGTFDDTPVTVVLSGPVIGDPSYFADMHVSGGAVDFSCTADQEGGMDCP